MANGSHSTERGQALCPLCTPDGAPSDLPAEGCPRCDAELGRWAYPHMAIDYCSPSCRDLAAIGE